MENLNWNSTSSKLFNYVYVPNEDETIKLKSSLDLGKFLLALSYILDYK